MVMLLGVGKGYRSSQNGSRLTLPPVIGTPVGGTATFVNAGVAVVDPPTMAPLLPTRTLPAGNSGLPTVVVIEWPLSSETPMMAVPPVVEMSMNVPATEFEKVCAPAMAASAQKASRVLLDIGQT